MPTPILRIILKLRLRHRIPPRLHPRLIPLLSIRANRRPWLLPRQTLARVILLQPAVRVAVAVLMRFHFVCEGPARGFGPRFRVEVVQAVDAAAGLLAADVDL